jgi:hypothetical protein
MSLLAELRRRNVYRAAVLFPLQSDPRFAVFCRKIGLPAPGEKAVAASSIAAADSSFAVAPASERKP